MSATMLPPDFLRFHVGQFLSLLGGRCAFLVLAWWMLASTGSKAHFAQLAFVFSGVGFVCLPLLAPLADRWPRKWCALVADLWTLGGVVTLYLVTMDGVFRPVITTIIIGALAAGGSLMLAVSGSIVPMLVNRSDLARAYAMIASLQAMVLLLAPGLAGYAADTLGLSITLVLAGGLLVVTLFCTLGIRTDTRPPPGDTRNSIGTWRSSLLDGWKLSTRIRAELDWNLAGALINGCMVPFSTLIVPVIVLQDLQLGMVEAGWFVAATAVGLLIGSRWTFRLFRRTVARRTTVTGVVLIASGALLFAVSETQWVLLIGSIVSGIGIGIHNVYCTAYRSAAMPDAYRGRLSAWGKWSAQAAVPLGFLLFGVLIQRVSSTWCVLVVSAAVLGSAAWLAFSPSIVELLRGAPEEKLDFYRSRYPSAFCSVR